MISGYTCVRNGVELDYCFELTVKSLLPVCEEVVVGYRDSTDGTLDILLQMQKDDPRIRLFMQPWDNPKGDGKWWTRWINEVRPQLKHQTQLMLDADEVLDDSEACHNKIQEISKRGGAAYFSRLNFVKDAHHLIPHGHCIGHEVSRLGPSNLWMPSDEPYPKPLPIHSMSTRHSALRIFHYGFIRRMEAFYQKIIVGNTIWFGSVDKRFDKPRETNAEDWYLMVPWGRNLVPWPGKHPVIARQWLAERGRL